MANPYDKPIAIIPADGWYAIYREEGENPSTWSSKIACIALFSDGDICFMDSDGGGDIQPINGVGNLVSVKYEK